MSVLVSTEAKRSKASSNVNLPAFLPFHALPTKSDKNLQASDKETKIRSDGMFLPPNKFNLNSNESQVDSLTLSNELRNINCFNNLNHSQGQHSSFPQNNTERAFSANVYPTNTYVLPLSSNSDVMDKLLAICSSVLSFHLTRIFPGQ